MRNAPAEHARRAAVRHCPSPPRERRVAGVSRMRCNRHMRGVRDAVQDLAGISPTVAVQRGSSSTGGKVRLATA